MSVRTLLDAVDAADMRDLMHNDFVSQLARNACERHARPEHQADCAGAVLEDADATASGSVRTFAVAYLKMNCRLQI